MNSLSIRARVVLGFAVLFSFLIAVSAVGVQRVGAINDRLTAINDVNSVQQRYAINFRGSVHDRAIALRDVVLFEDGARTAAAIAEIRELEKMYVASEAPLDALLADVDQLRPGEIEIVEGIKAIAASTAPLIEQVIALDASGDRTAAQALLLNEARPAFTEWLARINAYIDFEEQLNQTLTKETRGIGTGFVNVMLIATAAAVALGAALVVWIVRSVARLTPVTLAMRRLADGDIDAETPPAVGADEVADIARALGAVSYTHLTLPTVCSG